MSGRSVPITLVSGFRGAGKSTLVEHLKKILKMRRAVFIRDDSQGDIFSQIESATEMQGADVIVIECASDMEPYSAAEALLAGVDDEPPPRGVRVDTLVTVIDASRFLEDVLAATDLRDVLVDCDVDDDRTVSEVLIEQVEFADVIILNKIDLARPALVARVSALLERLNPRAKIIPVSQGNVESSEIIGTGLFDPIETDDGAGWLAELDGGFVDLEVVSDSDFGQGFGGVSSFTFVERRPFHPMRLNALLDNFDMYGLVRAQGSIWVASRHHEIGVWSLAGRTSTLSYGGAWFAATPAREWPTDERERADIMNEWVPPFGDRRQEIAFIGIDMDEQDIRSKIKDCLMTANEMANGPDGWFSLPDPLPDWHVDTDDAF